MNVEFLPHVVWIIPSKALQFYPFNTSRMCPTALACILPCGDKN